MKTRCFYKAQEHPGTVESVTLYFTEPIPDISHGDSHVNTLPAYMALYQTEAKELAEVLIKVLPGGTFDQLLVEMFQKKASHFKVRFEI